MEANALTNSSKPYCSILISAYTYIRGDLLVHSRYLYPSEKRTWKNYLNIFVKAGYKAGKQFDQNLENSQKDKNSSSIGLGTKWYNNAGCFCRMAVKYFDTSGFPCLLHVSQIPRAVFNGLTAIAVGVSGRSQACVVLTGAYFVLSLCCGHCLLCTVLVGALFRAFF